jgi:glycosyltransferase involved in cell wall biosynthesis
MVPAYNPRADYLEETLRSVLQQDPGSEHMQIEVIDDRSTDDVAAQTVGRVGGGRVSFYAEPRNRGLAETWNRCIERARGHWVHILHQDDIVLPRFYERLRKGAEDSEPGAIFCYVVRFQRTLSYIEVHRESAGLLDDWHAKITAQQLIQCPAIAVRRLVYEQLGGFLPQLRYTPDWEMWQRVASQFSFWFEPSILACYRVHPDSATSRIQLDAADVREVREVIDLTTAYHSPDRGRMLAGKARSFYAELAVFHAREMLVTVGFHPALKQILGALRLCCSWRVIRQISSFFVLWFRIIASRLKRLMKPKANAPGHS